MSADSFTLFPLREASYLTAGGIDGLLHICSGLQISRGNGRPAQAASPLFAVIIKNFLVGEGAPQVVPTFGHLALIVYLTSAHSLSFLLVYEDSGLATWLSHSIASGDSGPGVIV